MMEMGERWGMIGSKSDGGEDVCLERKTDGQINLMHGKNDTAQIRQVDLLDLKKGIHKLCLFLYLQWI